MTRLICMALMLLLALPAVAAAESGEDYAVDLSGFKDGVVNARVSVHDPSIIEVDGRFYIFGSHMTAAVSDNLRGWTNIANGYRPDNKVWGNLFEEGLHVFDYAGSRDSLIPTDDGGTHVWAPDVIFNPVTGQYMMYYCTSSTFNASNLCLAVSDRIEGPYEWQACLICSGFDRDNLAGSNVLETVDEKTARRRYLTLAGSYNYKEWPNAIDPAVFFDADDRLWMVYGSWSGGIFLLELDPATGLVIHPEADEANGVDPYFGRHLMGGNHQSMEGPYILRDAEAGYYYLFVSYGGLSSHGGSQIRVFRAESPEGPYTDMNGEKPNEKGGHSLFGLKLSGNYNLPSVRRPYMATGHNSALIGSDGKRYLCFHTRYDDGTEAHQPIVKQYALNAEGWPCLLPYATRGEEITAADLSAEALTGRWYVVNQGTDISDEIARPFILYLRGDGTVGGESVTGSWSVEEDTVYLRLTLDGTEYSGIACRMQDDGGTPVLVFSAVGNNESVWGVKYEE